MDTSSFPALFGTPASVNDHFKAASDGASAAVLAGAGAPAPSTTGDDSADPTSNKRPLPG